MQLTMSWQTLLEQQAQYAPSGSDDHHRQTIIPLPGREIIRLAGEEAGSFLQNMLTNDVNALQVNQAQITGFCNPKGRLLAIFQLIRRQDDYLVILPAGLAEPISQRLNLFKLRSKVDISLMKESHVLGLVHPQADIGPAQQWQGKNIKQGLIVRQPGEEPRSLLIVDNNRIDLLSDWLNQGWSLAPEDHWQRLEIEAGLPMVFTESTEAFTPQQVNLDLIDGVSFKKGCYPGQEVVARLHYLGTPSRRLFLGVIQDSQLPGIHSAVTDSQGNTVGHIVQAQLAEAGRIVCQISLKLAALEDTVMCGDKEVISLTPLAAEHEVS
jgi:tRNA-modifying protein YgfZ